MIVSLLPAPALPPGSIRLPPGAPGGGAGQIRFGTMTQPVTVDGAAPAPAGELWLALDLWEALSVPWPSFRLQIRLDEGGAIELGPTIVVLFNNPWNAEALLGHHERYYGHLLGRPGLRAVGWEAGIDWESGMLTAFLLDDRPGREGQLVEARFPVPGVVRLTWSHNLWAIDRLRKLTGNRTFNWMRNISKWEFYEELSQVDEVAAHLPETRLLQGPTDLAAMLARHPVLFVKEAVSLRAWGVVRVSRTAAGIEVCRSRGECETAPDLSGAMAAIDRLVQVRKRCRLVQRGIPVTGLHGRPLDFRVLMVRDGPDGWTCPAIFAKIATGSNLPFTDALTPERAAQVGLEQHHGMSPGQAAECMEAVSDLCRRAADALGRRYHPLGILGFDLAVEASTHRLWLLEANSVPGWGYGALDQTLARSQVEYGLSLSGFPADKDRQP